MPKFLVIGDPHVTADDLDDCWNLIGLIEQKALEEDAIPLFLGDQHHNHALLHLDVMYFWREVFKRFASSNVLRPIALVGNHDKPGDPSSLVNAMMAYEGQAVDVISQPTTKYNLNFVPYCYTVDDFVTAVNGFNVQKPTLVCHATFDGSQFENGFYAKEGINPNLLPKEITNVISGHIHAPQQVGKIWYPGAPRWRISTDANTERAIWAVSHAEDGTIYEKKPYSTGAVCRQIFHRIDTPDDPIQLPLDPRHDWRIDVRGPAEWASARAAEVSGPSVRCRTIKLEACLPKVRESDGIDIAFAKYWSSYQVKYGTDRKVLDEMLRERLG